MPSDIPAAEQARRAAQEIAIFEGLEAGIHGLPEAFHWCNDRFLRPLIMAGFQAETVAGAYALRIDAALRRSGARLVFSIGCGDGQLELDVLRAADAAGLPAFTIIGLELAPQVVQRANASAAAAGLAGRFLALEHDLGAGLPGQEAAGAIIANHVLHHVVALEALLDDIERRLHPEGALITFDMIGRNGHMRWPELRPLLRRIWHALPPDKRRDAVFGGVRQHFTDWDCSIEGFEGIRAQDILPLLLERFEPAIFKGWGGIVDVFLDRRFGSNFDVRDPQDRAFIAAMWELQQRLHREGLTTPVETAAEFRSRRGSFRADAATAASCEAAARRADEAFTPLGRLDLSLPWPEPPEPEGPLLPAGSPSLVAAGHPAEQALCGGWSSAEPHGCWALLDEQHLRFRLESPVSTIALRVITTLPPDRPVRLVGHARGCDAAILADVPRGVSGRVILNSRRGARRDWAIRLEASAYARGAVDGFADARPLSYLLQAIEPMAG